MDGNRWNPLSRSSVAQMNAPVLMMSMNGLRLMILISFSAFRCIIERGGIKDFWCGDGIGIWNWNTLGLDWVSCEAIVSVAKGFGEERMPLGNGMN